jgi:hypothetical protein
MADVTLAECGGSCWLVEGEAHLDDLLMNTLPPGIEVAIVSCASPAEAQALWHRSVGEAGRPAWMIHPNILARVRGAAAPDLLRFAPWSALIDEAALALIAAASRRAAADPAARIALVDAGAGGDAGHQALGALRLTLLRQRFLEHGASAAQVVSRGRRPGDAELPDADTVAIVFEAEG